MWERLCQGHLLSEGATWGDSEDLPTVTPFVTHVQSASFPFTPKRV